MRKSRSALAGPCRAAWWLAPLLAVAVAGLGAPALAQDNSVDPDYLASVLENAGYEIEMFGDEDEKIQIVATNRPISFVVEFEECRNGSNCRKMGFFSGFATDIKPSLATVSGFVPSNRSARPFIDDEGDPCIAMNVELQDGMSDARFMREVADWEVIIANYARHLVS